MPENYIGLMCGTSLDSLDISLCSFGKPKKVKFFRSYKIKQLLKDKINECKSHCSNKKIFNDTDEIRRTMSYNCNLYKPAVIKQVTDQQMKEADKNAKA